MIDFDNHELRKLITNMIHTVKERNDNAANICNAIPDGDEDAIFDVLGDVDDHLYEGHSPDELVMDILDALDYGEYPFAYDSEMLRQNAESMMANSEKIHKFGDKVFNLLSGDVYCDEIGDFLSDIEDSMYAECDIDEVMKDILDIMERLENDSDE